MEPVLKTSMVQPESSTEVSTKLFYFCDHFAFETEIVGTLKECVEELRKYGVIMNSETHAALDTIKKMQSGDIEYFELFTLYRDKGIPDPEEWRVKCWYALPEDLPDNA